VSLLWILAWMFGASCSGAQYPPEALKEPWVTPAETEKRLKVGVRNS
jgi:hypothetical protein